MLRELSGGCGLVSSLLPTAQPTGRAAQALAEQAAPVLPLCRGLGAPSAGRVEEKGGAYHACSVPAPRPTNQRAGGREATGRWGRGKGDGDRGSEALTEDRKPGKHIPQQVYNSNPGAATFQLGDP